jgi:DNA-binding transcriptional LysR family regulator
MAIELYQLRSFLAVAEARHLTRAAEALHLSQPAVSSHVKALEESLGLRLFERGPAGMKLTAAGARLVAEARGVRAAVQRLQQVAGSLRGEVAGNLRIGTVSDPSFIRVGELLNTLLRHHPMLHLQLSNEVSGEALDLVRRGMLDASFYFGELTDRRIAGIELAKMRYRVVAPASWRDRVIGAEWDAIVKLPWILTPEVSTHRQMLHRLFDSHGVEPAEVVEADQEALIESLVVSGVGLSLMLEHAALDREAAGEICLWDDGENSELTSTLWFIRSTERLDDPLIMAIEAALQRVWQSAADVPVPAGEPAVAA